MFISSSVNILENSKRVAFGAEYFVEVLFSPKKNYSRIVRRMDEGLDW